MTGYIWKHLPYAVYMDTNVLRSVGHSLNKQWLSELLSITSKYGISLCISELVLQEWCKYIKEILNESYRKLFSSINLLKEYNIQVPSIEVNLPQKSTLVDIEKQKLTNAGFNIIKNCDVPLSQLLNEAIEKCPPFEHGGKGLCDAVILESYAKHAKENFDEARVLIISGDSAVKRSEDRFRKHEISVEFISESEIVEKLKSLLTAETSTYIKERDSKLEKYILTHHEPAILEYVKKTPLKITDWMLDNPFKEPEDRIKGTIEKILSIKPTKITKVVGGAPIYSEETPQGRYPIQIFVEIEINVIVRQYDFGIPTQTRAVVQPDMIDRNSPVTFEKGSSYQLAQEIEKTIKRNITVHATIDSEKEKKDIFDDFRIDKIV